MFRSTSLPGQAPCFSHGSNDSGATVTQESYEKSSSRSRKPTRTSKKKTHKTPPAQPLAKSQTSSTKPNMARSSVDVFQFLVDDNEEDKKSSPPDQSHSPVKEVTFTPVHTDESDNESSAVRSLHSDSGVSMASLSVVTPSVRGGVDDRLPTVIETPQEKTVNNAVSKDRESQATRLRLTYPDIPQATHRRHDRTSPPQSPRAEFTPRRTPRSEKHLDPEFEFPRVAPLSGYDLVADTLAQGRLPPVFRRFQRLNFRILLQLQDEIIEMEEQLASLDVADTRSRLRPDGSAIPASRRLQWQRAQSDLPGQRLEVLGRLYIKLEQYYQALDAAQKVSKACFPAVPAEIESFRTWLRDNKPLTPAESKFLDEVEDLIVLNDKTSSTTRTARSTTPDLIPLCILSTTLFPLICFKLTSGVLNRLIVLFAVLVAGLGSLEKLDNSRAHEHKQLLVACFGVSFLVALIF
ncbi:hypothetical protein B0A52_00671 [Exophiala mesophila]|uniref:DUF6594 domain-containing protein n=1 Tax=Exophiala mesophila TaxID=212818 RepID=A0A438NHV5_EXOME|nr:hypothetical protein B0A52_00671 [Exophiala mesophila]